MGCKHGPDEFKKMSLLATSQFGKYIVLHQLFKLSDNDADSFILFYIVDYCRFTSSEQINRSKYDIYGKI